MISSWGFENSPPLNARSSAVKPFSHVTFTFACRDNFLTLFTFSYLIALSNALSLLIVSNALSLFCFSVTRNCYPKPSTKIFGEVTLNNRVITKQTTASSRSMSETVTVPIPEALTKTKEALEAVGWDEPEATIQAEIMVAAETCGNNQGLVKMFKPELMAPAAGSGAPKIEKETASTATIDGNQAPGMLALKTAVDLAVKKSAGGVATVGVYNTSTSSGQLAYYAKEAAKAGRVVIITANSPEFVAAKAGAKATFGTNPLAFACPVEGKDPFVFDMSTAAIALFGVLTCKAKGEALPEKSAYTESGEYTTNVDDIHVGGGKGAIAAWGGHKGVGIALMIELLCAALSGGAVLGQVDAKKTAKSWGHNVIAIDPTAMIDGFPARAASIIQTVASSHPDGVRLPGDSSNAIADKNSKAGTIPVPKNVWDVIIKTAGK